MPVSIYIPVRIRVDAKAVSTRCGCIDDALTKAAARALANSRETVLAPRGAYAGLCLYSPRFTWTGSGAPQIPATRRNELEERWTAILTSAADRAGVLDFAREGADAPRPIPPNPSEILDYTRLESGRYAIPSYGDGDEPEGSGAYNPTEQTEEDAKRFMAATVPVGAGKGLRFPNYPPGVDVTPDFRRKTIQVLGQIPASGYLAALYQTVGRFALAIVRFPGPVLIDSVLVAPFIVKKQGEVGTAGAGFDPSSDYELAWYADASTAAEFEQVIFDFAKDRIQDLLRNLKRPHEEGDVRKVIKKFIESGAAPPGTVGFMSLRIDGFDQLLLAAKASWPRETIRVIPLSFLGELPAPGGGDGGGGGRGQAGGGDGGTAAGRGVPGGEPGGMRPCCAEPVKVASVMIDGIEYEWGPFECEPPMYQLGKNGDYMRELMRKVATKLNIPECEYAGRFCIEATNVVGMRQYAAFYQANNDEGELKPAPGGKGNLGAVNFKPSATPSIQTLRDLAGYVPEISHLQTFTGTTYYVPEYANLLGLWYTGNPASWQLRFIPAMAEAMSQAIGRMFITACFSVLMQLMRASRKGIQDRTGNEEYAAQFEQLMKAEILPLDYLKRLRDQLSAWAPKSIGQAFGEGLHSQWEQARNRVRDMFEGRNPYGDIVQGIPGSIVRDGGKFKIKDSSGTLWSIDDLDAEIALRTSIAEGIDPLVVQITADRDILNRFARNPNDIRKELATLLKEMLEANSDKMKEAQDDPYFAFGATKIYEAATRFSGTAGSGYNLTGLHKEAHDLIADAFKGDSFYREAIKSLFDTEEGKKALVGFFEFAGVVFLCVVCAPLGVVAGIATAAYHEHEALEEQKLFRGLLAPEMVITRAELETDLFCAELGLLLSFIPEGGKIASGVVTGAEALLKQELKTAITALGKQVAKGVAKEVLKSLEKHILSRFVAEFIQAQLISQFVGKLVIAPVADRISADFEKTLVAKAVAGGE